MTTRKHPSRQEFEAWAECNGLSTFWMDSWQQYQDRRTEWAWHGFSCGYATCWEDMTADLSDVVESQS